MEKIIAPISNPDDIRREAAEAEPLAQTEPLPAQPSAPQPVSNPAPFDTSNVYPQMTKPTIEAGQLLAAESQKTLIGVYVIGTVVLLSATLDIITSRGNALILAISVLEGLLGVGLLLKNDLARRIYVILGAIDLALSLPMVIGFIGLRSNGLGVSATVLITRLATLALTLVIIIYLSSQHVKAQFS